MKSKLFEWCFSMKELKKLFSSPLPSTRSGVFYNTFPYPTKISPESIAVYIATLTRPGDTVLDAFGGSGSTGIAALLCEHPTEQMMKIAGELGVSPVWGRRNAVLYEVGTYGSFAAKTLMSRLPADEFQEAVNDFVQHAKSELNHYYFAKDNDGREGVIRHIIWTDILICPDCNAEVSYFEEATSHSPVKFKKFVKCPHCDHVHKVDEMSFATEEYYDALLQKWMIRKKRVPAWVYGTTNGNNWNRAANDDDRALLQQIEEEAYDEDDFPREIQWGELQRSGYHFGITHLHHFYTKRNYMVMYRLWNATEKYPQKIANALKLLLLSYNATHCTLMTRVVAKKNAKDFVLTSAQSGVLYISRMPVEKNILLGLQRKLVPFYNAYKLLENCSGRINIHNSTSEQIEEDSDSIDFVFTDPPFGDFIPYAEVNQINELWLNNVTNRNDEIIISPSQHKDIMAYQEMLTRVFRGINRVLKPKASAAVVFHAAKAEIWDAFENVLADSGFSVCMTSILDKKQASFKQVVSDGSVQGDPLILLQTEHSEHNGEITDKEILDGLIEENRRQGKVDERRIYSLYINRCLESGMTVSLDAKDAYAYIKCALEG